MCFIRLQDRFGAGVGFGPLLHREGEVLSLPKGFMAKVISEKGNLMSDGLFSPGSHDGMGAFKWKDGKVILIRNHELTPGSYGEGPFGDSNKLIDKIGKDKFYDFAKGGDRICVGGTTTMVYDEQNQKIELEYLSLIGTVRNCSGGKTPWNSWISCEETSYKMGEENGSLEKDHGYNFEVPATDQIGLADRFLSKLWDVLFMSQWQLIHQRESFIKPKMKGMVYYIGTCLSHPVICIKEVDCSVSY
jgi:secreted PhoX family phosphatase